MAQPPQREMNTVKPEDQHHHNDTKKLHTDAYWKGVAAISCFLANFFVGGLFNSYGVIYTYMQESLGISEYQLSWIGSLLTGWYGLSAVLASVLVDAAGCRVTALVGGLVLSSSVIISSQTNSVFVFYLTLGCLPGIGLSLIYVGTMVNMCQLFSRWLPVVTGFVASGVAVGVLIWPPMTSSIADIMGWRGTLLLHGALLLHTVPAALWIKSKRRNGVIQVNREKLYRGIINYFQTFALPGVICFCVNPFFTGLALYIFPTFIPEYAVTTFPEMTSVEASLIISLDGIGCLLGRLLFSVMTFITQESALPIYLLTLLLCGISELMVTLCSSPIHFYINSTFYGMFWGGWAGVFSLTLVKQFGIQNLSKMIGIYLMTQGVGALCGPPVVSYLATITSPEAIFYAAGIAYVLSCVSLLPRVLDMNQIVPGRQKSVTLETVVTVSHRVSDSNNSNMFSKFCQNHER